MTEIKILKSINISIGIPSNQKKKKNSSDSMVSIGLLLKIESSEFMRYVSAGGFSNGKNIVSVWKISK